MREWFSDSYAAMGEEWSTDDSPDTHTHTHTHTHTQTHTSEAHTHTHIYTQV